MSSNELRILNGRYEVLGLLGKGGMGAVYRAQDVALNRPVAIKERTPDPNSLEPAMKSAREHFRREAQALAHLTHVHLPRIYDYFSYDDNEYIVMELIEGINLAEFVQARGSLSEALVLGWARQILDALNYLHSRNIIHRDIKPNNLILTPEENIVLVDFGLSKLYDPTNQNTSTTLRGVGTPEYAPLEQYAREVGRTEPRTDIYSLGATLYRLLAGKPPADVHTRLLNSDALTPLRDLNPTVSFNTEAVIHKAMSLYPQGRYQTALDMQQAFGFTTGTPRADKIAGAPTSAVGATPTLGAVSSSSADAPAVPARSMLSRVLPPLPLKGTDAPLGVTAQAEHVQAPAPNHERSSAPLEPDQPFDNPTTVLVRTPRIGFKLVRGALQMQLAPGVVVDFCRVPAGKFWMGSAPQYDQHAQKDEFPQRQVELDEYWIGKFPISVAQYTIYTHATGRQPSFDFPAKNRYPVVNVSWFDASIFCQWVSEATGKLLRLPTEAEWEKAARGTDGRIYPWGDDFDASCLNCVEGKRSGTTPIDQFPNGASPYGIIDMVGNVWEWNSDWYDPAYYAHAPARDPQGPEAGHYRALRGGAWFSDQAHTRAADRTHFNPENHYDYVGFRCVLLPG